MARTTKHLKPHQFKKGEASPNPAGRPPLTPEQRALRKLTLSTYQEVIELALTGDIEELKAFAANEKLPAIQVGIARAILKAIKDGDPSVLERFAARIVGEIPKNLNVNGYLSVNHQVTVVPPEIARRAMKEIEDEC